MQNIKLLIGTIVGSLLLIIGVGWWLSSSTNAPTSQAQLAASAEQLVPNDAWTKGASESARFTIVEFSDFQCPACAAAAPAVRTLVEQYPDDVRLIYRHFPLRSIHQHAVTAAKAAEAAGAQGKFWEMHDALFAQQSEWSLKGNAQENMRAIAESLGLDMTQYDEALQSAAVAQRVTDDEDAAAALNLNSTPSFYLNGEKMDLPAIVQKLRAELTQ